MEIPNARILEDGEIRAGAAQALPYRWYTGGIGILPRMELSFRLTNITNIPTQYTFSNLDRAFDVKLQLVEESKILPAIAIGAHDFYGTRLFPAEYLVMSRQVFPFDFTVGIGRQRLKGSVELPGLDDFGLFGGLEIALHERINLLAEYNPVKYEDDKPSARGVPEGASLPLDVGIRYKALEGLNIGISYQRGHSLGLMLHIQLELGKNLLPHRADPPRQVPGDRRLFREREDREMIGVIHNAIHDAGFSDVSVFTDGSDIVAEFENNQYLSNEKAIGRVLRIILYNSPSDTDKISAVARKRDMPMLKVSVKAEHFEKFLMGEIPEGIFFNKLLDVRITDQAVDNEEGFIHTERDPKKIFTFGVKPDFITHWLDASNYVQMRPGVKPYTLARFWKGSYFTARYDIPFYSNVRASSPPAPDPIRSDQTRYMDRNYSFDRLILDQAFRLHERDFGRLSLGYFEKEYAGIGGEILHFFGDGCLAMGIEADWVIKREPHAQFELMDFKRHSILGNLYYYYPDLDITFKTQYGRFLAGDTGWMFDVSREYDTGIILGIYYTYTDTDDVKGFFNQGYNHKGVYLRVPVRMFLTRDSTTKYNYGISPWTRDVGQTVFHWQDIYNLGKDLMPVRFRSEQKKIKD
ncbi:MAG: YjbH domain-containing protein [Deltaproteobacteria bacterium]|nr:YjbH domain-containing protein [Deltaproteobacteria bacterium]